MKERLDILLVERNLAPSREKAKALIMSGIVYVDGQKEDKAGSIFDSLAKLEIRGEKPKFVSRGGHKLEKALKVFDIDLEGLTCMDIGASTGGFTDCMLQAGAKKIYSIDVGHGQLDWGLRNDKRVVSMEKTNFRYLTPEDIEDEIDFASCDVSFISLSKIIPPAVNIVKDTGRMVFLIKPQFEAGREKVGKKGVVRDREVHREVIARVCTYVKDSGCKILGLDYSPIKGPEGNIEYLIYFSKGEYTNLEENRISDLVDTAFMALSKDA